MKDNQARTSEVTRREFVGSVSAGVAGVAALSLADPAEAVNRTSSRPIYRIHPAIGVARLGNLDPDQGFIIGPEAPGAGATDGFTGSAVTEYKVNGLVKPQAARFRIFEYSIGTDGRLTPKGEVLPQTPTRGTPFVKAIVWTAHLANRKSSFYKEDGPRGEIKPAGELRNPSIADRAGLESDFGPRTISGTSAAPKIFNPSTAGNYKVRSVRAADGSVVIDYLGQLRTDAEGRLLLFGGQGRSRSSLTPPHPLSHWSNNNYWFDDTSDGPVTAVVQIDDGSGRVTEIPVDDAGTAWALVAPPDFSPGLQSSVSLYDVLYDLAVREIPIPVNNTMYDVGGPLARLRDLSQRWGAWQSETTQDEFEFGDFQPDYETEIWPIILNAVNLVYTTGLVNFKHSLMLSDPLGDPSDAAEKARQTFFGYLRAPEDAANNNTGPGTMPRMYGDNWYIGEENFVYSFAEDGTGNAGGGGLGTGRRSVPKYQRYMTLTRTQYGLLRSWQAGNFIPPPSPSGPPPVTITPHGLDRAALENCSGGAFYPGIECGWQLRNPALFAEPFRLKKGALSQYIKPDGQRELTPIQPGHFSRQMAIPWQADFLDCTKLLNLAWWPAARPDDVFLRVNDKLSDRVPWMRPDTVWSSGSADPTYEDMVTSWYKLGFVLEEGVGFYVEKERNSPVP